MSEDSWKFIIGPHGFHLTRLYASYVKMREVWKVLEHVAQLLIISVEWH